MEKNMPYLASLTVLGNLDIIEVYEYYEVPRLFICRNQYGQFYITLSVKEDNSSNTWLYAPISMNILKRVCSGEIDLYDVFMKNENGCVFKAQTYHNKTDRISTLLCKEIPDEWIPLKGEKLSVKKTPVFPGMEKVVKPKIEYIIQAFEDARDEWSSDRIIADPFLNKKFLKKCHELGIRKSDFEINSELMNARKANRLSHLKKSKRFTLDANVVDKFYYACELSIKYFRLTKGVTLDTILCDSKLAQEFDMYASSIAPGFSSLEYRWTALSVRKRGGLKKDIKRIEKELDPPDFSAVDYIRKLKPSKVPDVAGFYMFSSYDNPIFINQTNNLHFRLEQHLRYTNNNGLPEWLWEEPLQIAFAVRQEMKLTDRKIMELSEVRKRNPLFNFFAEVA